MSTSLTVIRGVSLGGAEHSAPSLPHVEPQPWRSEAACSGDDPELWFADDYETQVAAVATCNLCPIKDLCLADAVENRLHDGIFGGLTAAQRRSIRRGHKPEPLAPKATRTPSGQCRNGHEVNSTNTYRTLSGKLVCRPCHNARMKRKAAVDADARRAHLDAVALRSAVRERMHREGATDREMADATDVSTSAIEHWRRTRSLPANRAGAARRG